MLNLRSEGETIRATAILLELPFGSFGLFATCIVRVLSLILFIVLLIFQYQLWFGEHGVRDLRQLQAELRDKRAQTDALAARNRALAAEIKDLKTGLTAVEERARNDLGMIRDGEVFFHVVGSQTEPASPPPDKPTPITSP